MKRITKQLSSLAVACAMVVSLAGCGVSVTGVSFDIPDKRVVDFEFKVNHAVKRVSVQIVQYVIEHIQAIFSARNACPV